MSAVRGAVLGVLLAAVGVAAVPAGESPAAVAERALKAAGRDQGLCLVIGDDGGLAAALAKGSRMYVQLCTGNAGGVIAARKALVDAGVVHRSSAVLREASGLPYADNLVNLLVAADSGAGGASPDEILRVLAPGGVAVVPGTGAAAEALKKAGAKQLGSLSGGLAAFAKPLDAGMGEWTHIKAGADQSYTSEDRVVGPWKELRWIGDPRWGSLYLSYGGLVTAGGRVYYKECHCAGGASQWHLVCRDAYNGFEVWRETSGPVQRKITGYADFTLCCDDSRVYLEEEGVLVARDGLTGRRVGEYAGFSPRTVTSAGPVLLASGRSGCVAFHKDSRQLLWKRDCNGHPASDGASAFVVSGDTLEVVDLASGTSKAKGKVAGLPAAVSQAFIVEVKHKAGVVYVVAYEKWKPFGMVAAHDAATGRQLWKRDGKFTHGVLPFEDEVWCMDRDNKNKVDNMAALVLEARSGTEKSSGQIKGSVMSKCWDARASHDYVMYSNGWYVDRRTRESSGHPSTRSPCGLGQHPANGLTYFMPHHCDCHVTIRGFLAASPAGKREWFPAGKEDGDSRLFRSGGGGSGGVEKPDDWPTYRRDAARSNSTTAALPANVAKVWSRKLGADRLTQATAAYGAVYVAERDAGRLFALDAADGNEKWSFVADGRIEFPPTLQKGLCIFGTGAGTVYCLDAAAGRELWRLRAAPTQKFIGDRNRFDSPWPVSGSVLVMDGVAYFSAGRSSCQTGGGLWYYAVDAASGAVKWRKRGQGAGDMFISDGKLLFHARKPYAMDSGEKAGGVHKMNGILHTTCYLGAVSVVDYMATVEPNLSHKKHIELTDGRIKGDCLAFSDKLSVAGWRYTPGVPGWKDKDKTDKWFVHAAGSATWNLHDVKQHLMGIVLAGERVYAAGRPTSYDAKDKSELWVLSAADGKQLQALTLEGVPVYDGLSAAGGRLYLATEDGTLTCFGR